MGVAPKVVRALGQVQSDLKDVQTSGADLSSSLKTALTLDALDCSSS